jgi:tetratricopeptide (TPR) repeat protein
MEISHQEQEASDMSSNRPDKKNNQNQEPTPFRHLIDELNKAIESNPKDAVAYFNRGMIYHEQGKHDLAIADYQEAVRLEPTLKALIESHEESKRKRGDALTKIHDEVLVTTQSSFLAPSDLNHLTQTNTKRYELFKTTLAFKKLLGLVVRYELDKKKTDQGIRARANPILREVDVVLEKDPTLALKRDHITDRSGRKFYGSPLEAAHWSGNWLLRDMIFEHAKSIPAKAGHISGEARAIQQLREWDAKAYNYDLTLMRAEGDTFPVHLKKIPTLIQRYNEQGEDEIFQWGDVNGEWKLTELDSVAKKMFAHLNFPDTSSKKSITVTSNQITAGMYDALKKGHTITHFDLDEYVRVTGAFLKKYPTNVLVPEVLWRECNTDSYKIGAAQKKMPAWLAGAWCSNLPFDPLPDVRRYTALPMAYDLKLLNGEDFFDNRLGKRLSIYKGRLTSGVLIHACRHDYRVMAWHDLEAMEALSKVITEKLSKFMQLLPEEPKSTPRFSSH